MMAVLYTNNAISTLAASITNTATSFSVASGHGARFPAPGGSDFFFATLSDSAGNIEIVQVTARSADTFTVVRGQDGTSGLAWSAGAAVELRITKGLLDQFKTDTLAGNAASATTATTANGLNTANNYQVNSLGVGTAGSGTAGEIRATNNITAYYSSDIQYKENVYDIPDAALTVCAIGGKLFDWTDAYIEEHGGEDGYFIRKQDFGVIAQDVQQWFPRAVRTRPDGSLAVDYEKLCALALAAIREQQAQLQLLETKVNALMGA